MRVLILASYFPKPGNALMGTWALDQAQALRRQGAEVEVISLTPWVPFWPGQRGTLRAYSGCPAHSDWNGLRVHYPRWGVYPVTRFERIFRARPEAWLRAAWWLCENRVTALARAFQPDVILAHHTSVNGWVAERLSAALPCRFFTQDHAQWEIAGCNENPRLRRLYQRVSAAAAGMLAVSRQMAGDLHAICPQASIVVIPNGANLPPASGASATLRPALVFSAGMLVAYKGFDQLLEAWSQVHARFPDARLRIAGDGPERERLHRRRDELGLGSSVEFLGYVKPERIQAEMAAARLFVLASWNETFGVVFLEAAACGTPCIWARNAGVADVLADGVHGLAITPHDTDSLVGALSQLLQDPAQARALGEAAERKVRADLTWDAIARRMLDQFSTLRSP